MKIETLKKDNKKKITIGVIAVISIISTIILASSFAKYKLTESIPLANGTINYTVPDLNVLAMYQENEAGEYEKTDTIPESGYTFSSESYCATIKNEEFTKDESITINYDMNTKTINIVPLTKRARCYLYFDKIRDTEAPVISKIEATEITKTSIKVMVTATDNEGITKYMYSINNGTYTETTSNTHTFNGLTKGTSYTIKVKAKDAEGNESEVKTEVIATENDPASDTILGDITPKDPTTNMFANAATTDEGVFKAIDDTGKESYYYRGAVTNNYLRFANKWWRIIRINGDGTIRIIYDGTAYHANGTSTSDSQIGTSAFNSSYNDNAYVGFMYGQAGSSTYAATHTNTNKSTIMSTLETWYTNNLATYEDRIDRNAGFCGDRSINTGSTSWWSSDTKKGYGTNTTAYGPFSRILNTSGNYNSTQTPTFNCPNNNDLYTVKGASKGNKAMEKPIGLITADEVVYAGGFGEAINTSYYLRNGNSYWTMSPSFYNGRAHVFYVYSDGRLRSERVVDRGGVRPVINLRSDVKLTGSGTGIDPFVVVGAE